MLFGHIFTERLSNLEMLQGEEPNLKLKSRWTQTQRSVGLVIMPASTYKGSVLMLIDITPNLQPKYASESIIEAARQKVIIQAEETYTVVVDVATVFGLMFSPDGNMQVPEAKMKYEVEVSCGKPSVSLGESVGDIHKDTSADCNPCAQTSSTVGDPETQHRAYIGARHLHNSQMWRKCAVLPACRCSTYIRHSREQLQGVSVDDRPFDQRQVAGPSSRIHQTACGTVRLKESSSLRLEETIR